MDKILNQMQTAYVTMALILESKYLGPVMLPRHFQA